MDAYEVGFEVVPINEGTLWLISSKFVYEDVSARQTRKESNEVRTMVHDKISILFFFF